MTQRFEAERNGDEDQHIGIKTESFVHNLRPITQNDMLANWAIGELTHTERWSSFHEGISEPTRQKLNTGVIEFTPDETNELTAALLRSHRTHFLQGLLRLHPAWYEGTIDTASLDQLHIINWPDFTALTPSRQLGDFATDLHEGKIVQDQSFMNNLSRLQHQLDLTRMVGKPIMVSRDGALPYVVIEGTTRTTTMLQGHRDGTFTAKEIPIMLGISENIDDWHLSDDPNALKLF